jgi:predicted O-methyltransferase YrrM
VGLKSVVLRLLERANYALVHADELERERYAASVNLNRLRALSEPFAAEVPDILPANSTVRPLEKTTRDADFAGKPPIDKKWIDKLLKSKHFAAIAAGYRDYPARSYVSSTQRAFLFCLIRTMKPYVVGEIGTAFGGTSELIARALWENGMGVLHTTDPFGAERIPPIIAGWPKPLREITTFYPQSSMNFFMVLAGKRESLDLAFIDGNHDLEFVYFDIEMSARLLRPGGIMIIDNSEQTGPYYAAAQFLRENPDWIELGEAIAGFKRSAPFCAERSSVPDGGFLVLRAPDHYAVGTVPCSTGQIFVPAPRVDGLTLTLAPGKFRGTLHYQIYLRAFRSANTEIEEYKRVGRINIDAAATGQALAHRLDEPLVSRLHERHGDCRHTVEIEVAWEGTDAQRTLRLTAAPLPLLPEDAARDVGLSADLLPETGNARGP